MATSTQKAQARLMELVASEAITISIQNAVDSPRWRDYHSLSTYKIILRRPAERGRPTRFTFYHATQPGADRPTVWDVLSEQGFQMLQMLDVSSLDDYCGIKGINNIDQTTEARARAERSFAADFSHIRLAEDFFGDDATIEIMEIVNSWIEDIPEARDADADNGIAGIAA